MDYFANYREWREAITGQCGLALSAGYCGERLQALRDPGNESTRDFVELYGNAYLDRVVSWFERARDEITEP